jgi:hypothetical protein
VDHEICAACGFDGASYDDRALLTALRALGSNWRTLLDARGSELWVRPEPEVWSAIEYAAHSRDVTAYGYPPSVIPDDRLAGGAPVGGERKQALRRAAVLPRRSA